MNDSNVYDKSSIFFKFIEAYEHAESLINECIVLNCKCPVLLSCSAYEIARLCSKYPSNLSRDAFLKTISANFEIKDYSITYKSNEYYIEIDCQLWSQMERKLIPDCLKHILKTKHVLGKNHLIILQNIDSLNDSGIGFINCIINKNLMHATFILTFKALKHYKSIFKSNATILFCKYNIEYLINIIKSKHPDDEVKKLKSSSLVDKYRYDMSEFCAILHSKNHINYIPQIELYILNKLDALLLKKIKDAYIEITHIVNDLMSSYILITDIFKYILDYTHNRFPNKLTCIIKIIADAQVDIVESNKIVFAYEMLFVRLYKEYKFSTL